MPSLQVVTLGCSKNTVDTEHLLAAVRDRYTVVPEGSGERVDWLLVNTCGFIGDAKEQSVQAVLQAVARKKRGEAGRVLVFGCLSQRYMKDLPELVPEVDGWYGARSLDALVQALGCPMPVQPGRLRTDPHHAYAYLKISEGCDRRCAYCAIPSIRGAHRSVPMEVLVEEAAALAAEGVKELVLIAQDTTYYGLDLYGRRALAELLRRLSAVPGIGWLRVHYSYPADFPEDVLVEMADNPKVCRYMDIPLQHISDRVLKKMRRGLDGARTRALVARMRELVPGVVLRTTMITGHPGEGRPEFEELLSFVREARFERLGAFAYSAEEGTYGGDRYADRVSRRTKERRIEELMEVQRAISLSFNQSRVGSEVRVLADDVVDGTLVCRSEYESPEVDGEILVRGVADPAALVGRFLTVRVTGADEYDLTAELL